MDPLDVTKKLIGGVFSLCFITFLGYQFMLPAATSEAAALRAELHRLSPPPGVRVLNEQEAFSHNGPKHALIEAFYSAHAEPASLVAHYERALRTAGWVVETCGHVAPTSARRNSTWRSLWACHRTLVRELGAPPNKEMQRTKHCLTGASPLISVFCGPQMRDWLRARTE
jgi:hypothetical protein